MRKHLAPATSRDVPSIRTMPNTLRNTTADFRGADPTQSQGEFTSWPSGPEPSLFTSVTLSCQELEILVVTIVRTVAIALALHTAAGGATVSLMDGSLAGRNCYAVSIYPERTLELSAAPSPVQLLKFAIHNLDLLLLPGRALGTWVNRDKGTHVIDVVDCPHDRDVALELGSRFKQLSIFDLAADQEIPIQNRAKTLEEATEKPHLAERGRIANVLKEVETNETDGK